jgi:hypothetical protein
MSIEEKARRKIMQNMFFQDTKNTIFLLDPSNFQSL